MTYEKRSAVEGVTEADAPYFNHMQDGIAAADGNATSAVGTAAAAAIEAEAAAAAATAAAGAAGSSSTATGLVSLENGERPIASNGEKGEVGEGAQSAAVSADGRHIYVTSPTSKLVYVFAKFGASGLALAGTVSAGTEPRGISVSPNGQFVHVCDYGAKKILCFLRNRYTGELKLEAEVEVKNKAGAAAKIVHCACSPDNKHLYVVGEEEANKGNVYQFEIEATSKVKALAPELVAASELGFCNYVALPNDGKTVFVGFEGGLREFSRVAGTGILTNVATRGTSSGVGSIACSPDNESVYATCGSENKLIEFSRNKETGILTAELGTKAVTKAQGVSITPDGLTVLCTSTTLNEVFGFQRAKPAAAWELTAFATPSVATDTKPFRTLPSPDGVNVYVLCETSKTLRGYSRFVQAKVETKYVTPEGGIPLNALGEKVNGKLHPAKRVSQTSFYVVSDNPADTGKVFWSMPAEGPSSAALEQRLTLAYLATLLREQDWAGNYRPFSPEVGRYDMTAAPLIAEPLQKKLLEALKEGAREKEADPLSAAKISKVTLLTNYAPNDFNVPIMIGKATDPEYTCKDGFGDTQTKVHIPAGALAARAEGDHDLAIFDAPTGRMVYLSGAAAITIAGSNITVEQLPVHDYLNGPSYSSNSKEHAGGEVQMGGAAAVAGSTHNEAGGPSAARIDKAGYAIRFRQLQEADASPFGPPQMMRACGRLNSGPKGAGTAPRGTTLFGNGVIVSPEDGRAPYVGPLAHQGEVSESSNVYALPMGAMLRLDPTVWTQEFIEGLNCPNWVRWVYWCLRSRGTVLLDLQGQTGFELCRVESLRSYSYRSDPYATSWLEKHAKSDGAFCVQTEDHGQKAWQLDITGGGLIAHATVFAGLQIVQPPAKPAAFPN